MTKKSKKGKVVDTLKTEHECDEHWKLRRLFLVAHSKKFDKNRLECLAQVFINVEILGCRYPKETMDLVASLSAEIPEIESYREKRKNKLKRTFVQASDAAETRAKGLKKSKTTTTLQEFLPPASANKPPESVPNNPFGRMVILENKFTRDFASHCNDTVERSFITSGYTIKDLYRTTQVAANNNKCEVIWKGNVVCSVTSELGMKEAKQLAAKELLKEMKNYCYTVEVLKQVESSTTIERSVTDGASKAPMDKPLAEENKGSKMLRMMGWSGGGLGKSGQGIADPICAVQSVNRSGLGLDKLTVKQSWHKIAKYLDEFLADETAMDLEFAADFTKDERAYIHQFARKNHRLKTRSHGGGANRRLVVSKKVRPWDMVTRLINAGGSTTKHNLVWPLLLSQPSK